MSRHELAVVIPAYRARYFDEALGSLAAQTDKDFTVYIGDDGSPEDLRSIVEPFRTKLDLHYHRFPDNIGARNLVHQWNRCIDLAGDEPWLWLFSDDDVAEPGCVAAFRATLASTAGRFDVYRFNTVVIDRDSKVVVETPVGPAEESSAEMAYHLLKGLRGNSMPDHIFRRSEVERHGGFVYTEYAQAADWASSILLATRTGIRVIGGPRVRWRMSGTNVSSAAARRDDMVAGHLRFIRWALRHFENVSGSVTQAMIREAALENLSAVVIRHYQGLSPRNAALVYRFLREVFGLGPLMALRRVGMMVLRSSDRAKRLYRRVALRIRRR